MPLYFTGSPIVLSSEQPLSEYWTLEVVRIVYAAVSELFVVGNYFFYFPISISEEKRSRAVRNQDAQRTVSSSLVGQASRVLQVGTVLLFSLALSLGKRKCGKLVSALEVTNHPSGGLFLNVCFSFRSNLDKVFFLFLESVEEQDYRCYLLMVWVKFDNICESMNWKALEKLLSFCCD